MSELSEKIICVLSENPRLRLSQVSRQLDVPYPAVLKEWHHIRGEYRFVMVRQNDGSVVVPQRKLSN